MAEHIKGHRRLQLILDLARGDLTQAAIAEKYERSGPTISQFVKRHTDEIEEVRTRLADEAYDSVSSLWVADKAYRIAEYQQDVEDINAALEGVLPDSGLLARKHSALHAVAEELGQLTLKIDSNTKVRHEIVGIDPEDLT